MLHLKLSSIFFKNARFLDFFLGFGEFPMFQLCLIFPTKNFKFRKIRLAKNWFSPPISSLCKLFYISKDFFVFFIDIQMTSVIIFTFFSSVCWFEAKSQKVHNFKQNRGKIGHFNDLASNQQIREQNVKIITNWSFGYRWKIQKSL